MKTTIDNTYYANIYMVGDIDHCKQFLSKYVKKGACVTVTPTEYIYTGGRETGFIVGLINYPKFPRSDEGGYVETLVMLLPSRTDTIAFHEYIYGKAEIRFIKGRLKFEVNGVPSKNAAPFPSMLVIYR